MTGADELVEIGRRHGSHKWSGHFYAEPYFTHIGQFRNQQISLLEIGVGGYDDPNSGGHSLRAWKEFFPHAKIYGLDFFYKAALEEDRIKIFKGSQVDPKTITEIMTQTPDGVEVIIDDGSHRSEHIIATFYMLWGHLKLGGWYIIEDLQTSYWPNHGGKLNADASALTSMNFLKGLVDGLNWQEIHQPTYNPTVFEIEITSISFYHNIVFIQKGRNIEGSTQVRENRISGV